MYRLTERGLELAPVLVEMILWGANHFETGAPPDVVAKMEKDPRGYAESLVAQFKQEG